MEIVTLGFPIYQIFKHKRAVHEMRRTLDEFSGKSLESADKAIISGSANSQTLAHVSLPSTIASKRGGMYSMESLDQCLTNNSKGLQTYASCMELNGENIVFLTRVLSFQKTCTAAFQSSCRVSADFHRARKAMFRIGLGIFLSLVHVRTANYPINIESVIYARLDSIFGYAAELVASKRRSRRASISTATSSDITPWDEPTAEPDDRGNGSFPMHAIGGNATLRPPQPALRRRISDNDSREHIVQATGSSNDDDDPASLNSLNEIRIPADFDEKVFDAAFKSVRYMVWTETWQRYMNYKSKIGVPEPRISVREVHV